MVAPVRQYFTNCSDVQKVPGEVRFERNNLNWDHGGGGSQEKIEG